MSAALTWEAMWVMYERALATENAYDSQHIRSVVSDELPIGPERSAACDQVTADVWEESGRLGEIRCNIEDDLLAMPSPTWAAFGRKVIICRADGRDLNGLDDMLVGDARRLLEQESAR